MRVIPLFAVAALFSMCVCPPAQAQSKDSTTRWLPRIGDIFGGKKNNETDKKSKTTPPAQKPPAKTENPPTLTSNPVQPSKEPPVVTVEEKSTRLMEILIELALLADPVTFPYLLEARVEGQTVKLRGTVSSKSVRDHALKIVRVHCPLTAIDAMKEHPGSAPKKMPTDVKNLENSAVSALKQAFPKELPFEVKCSPDGKAEVSGFVRSFEEKLRVSQTLRRLHGCTHVHNVVHVLADEAVVTEPAKTPPWVTPASSIPTPVFRKSPKPSPAPQPLPLNPSENPSLPAVPKVSAANAADIDLLPILERMSEQPMKMSKSLKSFPGQNAKATKPAEKTTTAKAQPKVDSGIKTVSAQTLTNFVMPPGEERPFSTAAPTTPVITPTTATPLVFPESRPATVQEHALPPATPKDGTPQMLPGVPASLPGKLKTVIEVACGASLRDVHVEVVSPTNIIVQFKVSDEAEGRQMARRVLALPELQKYRIEVRVKVPQ